MHTYISSKEELIKVIQDSVNRSLMNLLPAAIKKGLRKKWLTTNDVMCLLQCSRRHVQHLRDSAQIPYSQNNQSIRYDIDEIDRYMASIRVDPNGKPDGTTPF